MTADKARRLLEALALEMPSRSDVGEALQTVIELSDRLNAAKTVIMWLESRP